MPYLKTRSLRDREQAARQERRHLRAMGRKARLDDFFFFLWPCEVAIAVFFDPRPFPSAMAHHAEDPNLPIHKVNALYSDLCRLRMHADRWPAVASHWTRL